MVTALAEHVASSATTGRDRRGLVTDATIESRWPGAAVYIVEVRREIIAKFGDSAPFARFARAVSQRYRTAADRESRKVRGLSKRLAEQFDSALGPTWKTVLYVLELAVEPDRRDEARRRFAELYTEVRREAPPGEVDMTAELDDGPAGDVGPVGGVGELARLYRIEEESSYKLHRMRAAYHQVAAGKAVAQAEAAAASASAEQWRTAAERLRERLWAISTGKVLYVRREMPVPERPRSDPRHAAPGRAAVSDYRARHSADTVRRPSSGPASSGPASSGPASPPGPPAGVGRRAVPNPRRSPDTAAGTRGSGGSASVSGLDVEAEFDAIRRRLTEEGVGGWVGPTVPAPATGGTTQASAASSTPKNDRYRGRRRRPGWARLAATWVMSAAQRARVRHSARTGAEPASPAATRSHEEQPLAGALAALTTFVAVLGLALIALSHHSGRDWSPLPHGISSGLCCPAEPASPTLLVNPERTKAMVPTDADIAAAMTSARLNPAPPATCAQRGFGMLVTDVAGTEQDGVHSQPSCTAGSQLPLRWWLNSADAGGDAP
jgi:hypothetical protein